MEECLGNKKKIIFLPDLTVGLSLLHFLIWFFSSYLSCFCSLGKSNTPKNMFFILVVLHKDYMVSLQILMRRSMSGNREWQLLRY